MPIRIGIIGTNWGRMHLGAFREAGADVAAVCGHDSGKTQRIAEEERVPLATTDVKDLVRNVDAVVVAGPDALHVEHVLAALEQKRPVLCEKPLARTAKEAAQLVSAANNAGVVCAVNFPYRQLRPFLALRQWLHGRSLRRAVVSVRNGFGFEPQDASGPLLGRSGDFGGMSHALDAVMWLCEGPPEWVQASLQGRPVHSAMMHLGFAAERTVSFHQLSCAEPGIHGAWSLMGDDWEVGFSAGYVPSRGGWCISPIRLYEKGTWSDLAPGDEPRDGEREPWSQAHVHTARAFLRALEGERHPALASFEDGKHVQDVISHALQSQESRARSALRNSKS